jgi:hypothetical protein
VGSLKSISTALKRLARNGDAEKFRAYISSDAFLVAFNGLDPVRRRSAMCAFAKAETVCEAKAPRPLSAPKRIDAKRVQKAKWGDPEMRIKLVEAYAWANGGHEKAARVLGVSLGSARLAKKRYLGASSVQGSLKAP